MTATRPPYAGAPGAIRPTLADPVRIGTTFPTVLRTLDEARADRIARAAAAFDQAVRDCRGGAR